MERFSSDDFNDEHMLARYWLVLVRRWWIVAVVFIAMLIGGAVYANTRPPLPFTMLLRLKLGGLRMDRHLRI